MTARMRLQPEAVGLGMTSQRVRDRLIDRLRTGGISDERVLNAIRTVPRHLFVDDATGAKPVDQAIAHTLRGHAEADGLRLQAHPGRHPALSREAASPLTQLATCSSA